MVSIVKIRLATSEDETAWNDLVLNSSEEAYNCIFRWKKLIERDHRFEAPFVVAEENKEIIGIYPNFIVPVYYSTRLYSCFPSLFINPKNNLCSFSDAWFYCTPYIKKGVNKEILKDMILFLESYIKKKGVLNNYIMPYSGNIELESNLSDILDFLGYKLNGTYISQVIDLTMPISEIYKNIKKNIRQDIEKSLKNDVYVVESTNENGLREFYKCIHDMQRRKDIFMPPYSFYKNALDIFGKQGFVKIHLVKHGNMTIGASYRTYLKDLVCLASAASYGYSDHLKPNHALYWNCIKESKELGYKRFDTCGLPLDINDGIYFFKSRWGGNIRRVSRYVKPVNSIDFKYKLLNILINKIKLKF